MYAIAMYGGGVIGDIVDQRKLVSFAYGGFAICTSL
jgi:hypothetical protein